MSLENKRFQSLPFIRFTHIVAILFVLQVVQLSWAQDKKQLEHSDYDLWNRVSGTQISNDGKWVAFSTRSAKKDSEATLYIRRNGSTKQFEIPRGSGLRFTFDSKHAIYRVSPPNKRIEELKKAKLSSDELPGSELVILQLDSGTKLSIDGISSFNVPQESGRWLGFIRPATAAEKLSQKNSSVNEVLTVTESGLETVEKKPKLKPRRENEFKMPEPKGSKKGGQSDPKESKGSDEKASDDKDKDKPDHKKKALGKMFVLHDLETGLQRTYPSVVRFAFDKHGTRVALVTSEVDDTSKLKKPSDPKDTRKGAKAKAGSDDQPTDGLHVIDLKDLQLKTVLTGAGEYKGLRFNEDGTRMACMTNKDDYLTKTPSWSIYHWKAGQKVAELAVSESNAGIPESWWIAPNTTVSFSEDDKRFYFDTAPVPESVEKERKEAAARRAGKDPEKEEAKAKLDLWHWQDPQLQPQQLLRANSDRNRSYRAAFQLKSKKVVQLATKAVPNLRIDYRSPSEVAVAVTDMPYRKMMSWDIPGFQDTYVVDLNTGEQTLVVSKSKANSQQISPEGKFLTWYDPEQKHWFALPTNADDQTEPVKISEGIDVPLYDELHDTPSLPRSYGSAGWQAEDAAFFIYDRYDIWKLDPSGKQEPECVSGGQGRKQAVRFRAMRLDPDQRAIEADQPVYLTAFDESTKASGYYRWQMEPGDEKVGKASGAKKAQAKEDVEADQEPEFERLKRLLMLDESLGRLTKARGSDDVMFTRSTFQMYPDVWTSTLDFKKLHRISDGNPQQKNYRWGNVELVSWKAADGQELEGLLYKPDDFDPSKQYPMMVYFYERNSDNLHRYYTPEAGRSIINFSFYVSRGYLVFVPDIPYRTGEPGPSASNAILPGVQSLIDQGFVKKDKVGMQGHSWGGYQTAYLVTQTDMFACAESGAPVSNMTSAYGGIRWSSGMSRMFQYEKTQSRIGQDLWSARDKYIANSPVFFADKVNTPLLILHNDKDGAVPWYQGIEMFVALRRLEKPAWLLNYNGDPHWVMGDANRIDFAKRMQQFFDHYLMDAPEPEWMAYGVPAVDKGKEFGFDLLEPKKETSSKSTGEAKVEEKAEETSD